MDIDLKKFFNYRDIWYIIETDKEERYHSKIQSIRFLNLYNKENINNP